MNVFMQAALSVARKAAIEGAEVPVGAVVVHRGEIIARAHNQKETLQDPTAHAEILAIRAAAKHLGDWRLADCDLYVTLEPCPMCMAAIREARIRRLYCGAVKPPEAVPLKNPEMYFGIEEEACTHLLQSFFHSCRIAQESNGDETSARLDNSKSTG